MNGSLSLVLLAALALPVPVAAQDSTPPVPGGVRVGITYTPGTRPVWAGDDLVIWIAGGQASAVVMDPRGNPTGAYAVSGSDPVQADIAVDGPLVFALNTYAIDENLLDGGTTQTSFPVLAQPGFPARLTSSLLSRVLEVSRVPCPSSAWAGMSVITEAT